METKTEKRKINLEGIEGSLPVDIIDENEGLALISHSVLENFIKNLSRISVTYKAVYICPPSAVVECHMTDKETGRTVVKVGETNKATLKNDISTNFGVTIAYQRAYNRAAIVMLGLSDNGTVYSDIEVSKAELEKSRSWKTAKTQQAQQTQQTPAVKEIKEIPEATASEPVQAEPKSVFTDETVMKIGGDKGKKFGEIKHSPKFKALVKWAKNTDPNDFKAEEDVKFQFLAIRELDINTL